MKVKEIAKQYLSDKACPVCANYSSCHMCFDESWVNCPKLTHFLSGYDACLDNFKELHDLSKTTFTSSER